MPPIAFACPNCAAPLSATLTCPNCGRAYAQSDGIYRFWLPEREQAQAPFLAQYRQVREQDGFRSRPAEYYRALPHAPADDPQAQTWRVRAATYLNLERRARLRPVAAGKGLAVLDLGAGNGWLSNRLSALGHNCAAVDWLDDKDDGLGAARYFEASFIRLQADFDHLPLTPGQFDLVVYNGSLHYSPDIQGSLEHGISMLRPGGRLAIMDSPTFQSRESAEQMITEQMKRHEETGDLPRAIRQGQGYLLANEILKIAHRRGLALRYWPTRGDLGWALRRRLAGIKLKREPAGFGLWLGAKSD